MASLKNRAPSAIGIALALSIAAGTASAGISSAIVRIEATSSLGTGVVELISNSDFQNGVLTSGLTEAVDVLDEEGDIIATVTNLNILLIADPVVNMNFALFAGAADTTFKVTSTLLSFPTLTDATGRASASLSVTDSNGNGAIATGLYDGGKAYRAFYNSPADPGDGIIFDSLIDTPITIADPFGSDDGTEESGPGFSPIAEPVSNMSTEFNFRLTALDQFAATSTFVVIPTPATLAIATAGFVFISRRRR
jgi:hypothetical protein